MVSVGTLAAVMVSARAMGIAMSAVAVVVVISVVMIAAVGLASIGTIAARGRATAAAGVRTPRTRIGLPPRSTLLPTVTSR